jgi:hypothetical protein
MKARASAEFDLTGSATPSNRVVAANTQFIDLLTISDPLLNGTTGTLEVSYDFDGVVGSSGDADALALVGLAVGGTKPFEQNEVGLHVYDATTSGTFTFAPFEFVYGQPFFFSFYMAAVAGTIGECDTCELGLGIVQTTGTGKGSADFFNTLVLSGLLARDASGAVANNVAFSSASGTRYTANGVVPEPASLFLFGTGASVALARWRRARRG